MKAKVSEVSPPLLSEGALPEQTLHPLALKPMYLLFTYHSTGILWREKQSVPKISVCGDGTPPPLT